MVAQRGTRLELGSGLAASAAPEHRHRLARPAPAVPSSRPTGAGRRRWRRSTPGCAPPAGSCHDHQVLATPRRPPDRVVVHPACAAPPPAASRGRRSCCRAECDEPAFPPWFSPRPDSHRRDGAPQRALHPDPPVGPRGRRRHVRACVRPAALARRRRRRRPGSAWCAPGSRHGRRALQRAGEALDHVLAVLLLSAVALPERTTSSFVARRPARASRRTFTSSAGLGEMQHAEAQPHRCRHLVDVLSARPDDRMNSNVSSCSGISIDPIVPSPPTGPSC